MRFVVEARHGVVRLRRKHRAGDATLGLGAEDGQAAILDQGLDERGDEHRLTGTRQAR